MAKKWMKKWEILATAVPERGIWVWFEPKTRTPKTWCLMREGDNGVQAPCVLDKPWQTIAVMAEKDFYGKTKEERLENLRDCIELRRDDWYGDEKKTWEGLRFMLGNFDVKTLRSIAELGKHAGKV